LAEAAATLRLDFETRTQIDHAAWPQGIYVAIPCPHASWARWLVSWADRWPKRQVMVASQCLRGGLVLLASPGCIPGPYLFGLSWGLNWGLDRDETLVESVLTQFLRPG